MKWQLCAAVLLLLGIHVYSEDSAPDATDATEGSTETSPPERLKGDRIAAISHYYRVKRAPQEKEERAAFFQEWIKLDPQGRRDKDVELYESLTPEEVEDADNILKLRAQRERERRYRQESEVDAVAAIAHHYRFIRAPLDKDERKKYLAEYENMDDEGKRKADQELFDSLSRNQRLKAMKETRRMMDSERPDMRLVGHNILHHMPKEEKIQVKIGNAILREEEEAQLKEMNDDQKRDFFKARVEDMPGRGKHAEIHEYHITHIQAVKDKYNALSEEKRKEWHDKIVLEEDEL